MKNIERKGEIARNEQFLLFSRCSSFYRNNKLPSILTTTDIVVHNLFIFERVRNLSSGSG